MHLGKEGKEMKTPECWGCGEPIGADMNFTVGCPGCDLGMKDELAEDVAKTEALLHAKSDILAKTNPMLDPDPAFPDKRQWLVVERKQS
jgi:hypothetical protein